ncbi:hypothetical protein F5B20DRAFT_475460 [Whalleya microplaca]|nr:hypothetical protein F5B20DRAFT_475460 [Whalleya microplaca]
MIPFFARSGEQQEHPPECYAIDDEREPPRDANQGAGTQQLQHSRSSKHDDHQPRGWGDEQQQQQQQQSSSRGHQYIDSGVGLPEPEHYSPPHEQKEESVASGGAYSSSAAEPRVRTMAPAAATADAAKVTDYQRGGNSVPGLGAHSRVGYHKNTCTCNCNQTASDWDYTPMNTRPTGQDTGPPGITVRAPTVVKVEPATEHVSSSYDRSGPNGRYDSYIDYDSYWDERPYGSGVYNTVTGYGSAETAAAGSGYYGIKRPLDYGVYNTVTGHSSIEDPDDIEPGYAHVPPSIYGNRAPRISDSEYNANGATSQFKNSHFKENLVSTGVGASAGLAAYELTNRRRENERVKETERMREQERLRDIQRLKDIERLRKQRELIERADFEAQKQKKVAGPVYYHDEFGHKVDNRYASEEYKSKDPRYAQYDAQAESEAAGARGLEAYRLHPYTDRHRNRDSVSQMHESRAELLPEAKYMKHNTEAEVEAAAAVANVEQAYRAHDRAVRQHRASMSEQHRASMSGHRASMSGHRASIFGHRASMSEHRASMSEEKHHDSKLHQFFHHNRNEDQAAVHPAMRSQDQDSLMASGFHPLNTQNTTQLNHETTFAPPATRVTSLSPAPADNNNQQQPPTESLAETKQAYERAGVDTDVGTEYEVHKYTEHRDAERDRVRPASSVTVPPDKFQQLRQQQQLPETGVIGATTGPTAAVARERKIPPPAQYSITPVPTSAERERERQQQRRPASMDSSRGGRYHVLSSGTPSGINITESEKEALAAIETPIPPRSEKRNKHREHRHKHKHRHNHNHEHSHTRHSHSATRAVAAGAAAAGAGAAVGAGVAETSGVRGRSGIKESSALAAPPMLAVDTTDAPPASQGQEGKEKFQYNYLSSGTPSGIKLRDRALERETQLHRKPVSPTLPTAAPVAAATAAAAAAPTATPTAAAATARRTSLPSAGPTPAAAKRMSQMAAGQGPVCQCHHGGRERDYAGQLQEKKRRESVMSREVPANRRQSRRESMMNERRPVVVQDPETELDLSNTTHVVPGAARGVGMGLRMG